MKMNDSQKIVIYNLLFAVRDKVKSPDEAFRWLCDFTQESYTPDEIKTAMDQSEIVDGGGNILPIGYKELLHALRANNKGE